MTGFELKEARTELEFVKDRFCDFPKETNASNSINNIQNAIKAIEELEEYYVIGTVEECREAREVKQKITEIVNQQLIAGKNNYKEVYDCFYKIAKVIQEYY